MSAHVVTPGDRSLAPSPELGAKLVALAGIGLVGYGLLFLIRNFTRFIELGLTPEQVGGTPEQIRAFSPHLFYYISHRQAAAAGFLTALGVAGSLLGRRGTRPGHRWPRGPARA